MSFLGNLFHLGGSDAKKASGPSPITVTPDQTLADLVRGIQHAVNASMESIEQHHIRTLDRFMDEVSGEQVPKRVSVKLDETHALSVPLVSLVQLTGLTLSEMTVEMAIRVSATAQKSPPEAKRGRRKEDQFTRTSFVIEMASKDKANKDDLVCLKMVFRAGDTPEGVARVVEQFTNSIRPGPRGGHSGPTGFDVNGGPHPCPAPHSPSDSGSSSGSPEPASQESFDSLRENFGAGSGTTPTSAT
jgi:hypothetical protein